MSLLSEALRAKLDQILKRAQGISQQLEAIPPPAPDVLVKLSKEQADLAPIVSEIEAYQKVIDELDTLSQMLSSPDTDPELKEMAEEEVITLKEKIPDLEKKIKIALLPKDDADARGAIIEIRAGTGGEEAALFATVLWRMYERYAEKRGWRTDVLSINETELGGIKELSLSVAGQNVFAHLKFESGVHRVQRVPETESSGRIHTSAATVAVLPEARDVDIQIRDEDIRIDTFRASGSGGQHVNKTDSAVRITHLPTGTVVVQQEKSQHQNRARAMKVLRSRLYENARQEEQRSRDIARKSQVGSGDRSERIRTYNFPQGRVTDHRINLTLYQLEQALAGDLDSVIDPLIAHDQSERLAAI